MSLVQKVCASTHYVYAIPDDVGNYSKKIGVINYPGSGSQPDKTKNHHAIYKGGIDLGHYSNVSSAAEAILSYHKKNRK